MNKRQITIAVMVLVGISAVGVRALINHRRVTKARVIEVTPEPASPNSTRADALIQRAQQAVRQSPNNSESYNLLASAFMQKARESSDFSFNAKAEAVLERSLEIDASNYDAMKLRAKLLLTQHRFANALEVAQRAQSMRPDDHDVYGAITDAQVELGNYPAAIEAAQKMIDLRPDSGAYARVSYLRSLHGDVAGAVQAMAVAVKAANPNDREGVAWCRVHLGDELMNSGRLAPAEREYDAALQIFPDYPLALSAKARARVRAGDLNQALELYQQAQQRVPLPDTAVALGDLYTKLGKTDEAKRQYELVEFIERSSAASGAYSRQLAVMWADHDVKLDEALKIVTAERSQRQDIFTCDAFAWVLFKAGRINEAKTAIVEAMRLGTRDARIYYHAGMIYHASGEEQNAVKYLNLALKTNPTFDLFQAEKARDTIAVFKQQKCSRGAACL